jgi:hypothetical protein
LAAFDDPDWLFELKHDGFRSLAYVENGRCRRVSGHRCFPERAMSLTASCHRLQQTFPQSHLAARFNGAELNSPFPP